MGSPQQHEQQQQQQVYQQLYGDRAYWQFVLHANNDIVLIVVFGLLLIHLLGSVALVVCTFTRGRVRSTMYSSAVYCVIISSPLFTLTAKSTVLFCSARDSNSAAR